MTQQKRPATNPANIFLRLAAFNLAGAILFLVFYFLYDNSGGDNAYFFLIAAGTGVLASGGSLYAYWHFKQKIDRMR